MRVRTTEVTFPARETTAKRYDSIYIVVTKSQIDCKGSTFFQNIQKMGDFAGTRTKIVCRGSVEAIGLH